MLVIGVSSQLTQCVVVGCVYKPSRLARRTDASRRCLSAALVKRHHAGEAYNSLEDDGHGLVDVLQRVIAHAVATQQFHGMQ